MAEKIKKPFWKKWWVWLIAIIVIIAIAGGSDEEENNNGESTKKAVSTEKNKQEEVKREFGVGEAVAVGNLAYTVNGVEEVNELKMEYLDSLTTEGKFVIVDLTITNNNKEASIVDTAMFRIIGSDGTEFSSNSEADTYVNKDVGFFLSKINPKMSGKGKVVFELPAGETGYKLQVSSGFGWSGGKYETINLGK